MGATDEQDGDRNTRFSFEHKVFSLEGSYFEASGDIDNPRFHLPMGETMAAISLRALRREFGIDDDSADGKLLDLVGKSLKYVKVIRVNDSIPRELLDGSASWSIDERHYEVARNRLTVQLVTWLSGSEETITNRGQLEKFMADASVKERVNEAFRVLAEKLGAADRKQEVVNRIEGLAHELAYIEALRDHFGRIVKIGAKLSAIEKLCAEGSQARDDLQRIRALLRPVVTDFQTTFELLDAQICEILVVLRNYETQVKMIRETRDDLHSRFMIWDEILPRWDALELEGDPETAEERREAADELLKMTYRFLAQNYPQSQQWELGGRG